MTRIINQQGFIGPFGPLGDNIPILVEKNTIILNIHLLQIFFQRNIFSSGE